MAKSLITSATLVTLVALPLVAQADVIGFEQTPGGSTPSDNSTLSTPYNLAGGGTVQFFFDTNGNNSYDAGTDSLPVFEAVGSDTSTGFFNGTTPDTAAAGYESQLGNFFLRQPSSFTSVSPFLIDYNTSQTITSFSGEIWDLDGAGVNSSEQWLIEALDSSNSVLASVLSPNATTSDASSLNGKPWAFSFTSLPSGFDKIRLTFTGTKTSGIGLAFDNFSPTVSVVTSAVPEPSSLSLFALGLLGLAARGVRGKKRGLARG